MALRYLAANTNPGHDTLSTFRRRFLPELEKLFVQVLLLAREMKLLKLGTIALYGTKFNANASKHKALSYGHAKKLEAQLKAEVKALTDRAESAEKADSVDGMDIPAEIARRDARLAAIAETKAKIEERVATEYAVSTSVTRFAWLRVCQGGFSPPGTAGTRGHAHRQSAVRLRHRRYRTTGHS